MKMDMHGRASFAVLALAILLLANLSVVYMLQVQREEMELANQANGVRMMREFGALVHKEVEVAAHYIAMTAVRNATEELNNQSMINELFSASFAAFIQDSFPRDSRGFRVVVEEYGIIIVTETKSVEEVVKMETIVENIYGDDSPQAIETGEPGGLEENPRISYYHLIGHMNYTISDGITSIHISEEIASEIDSPFPFVNRQLQRFAITSQGPMSHSAQALRYMLTTVAQQRVLLGYAGGDYGKPGTGIANILTPQDIELAVNIVLILEQIRLFRSFDGEAVDMFDRAYFAEYAGGISSPKLIPTAENRTLARLLGIYAGNGTLDPADIFGLFTALDKDDVPINSLLAQALYAMIDQFALKYMDYIDFLPLEFIADLGLGVLELMRSTLDQFVGWLTNHRREADLVREFVIDLFESLDASMAIMGPASLPLPARTYTVIDGGGQKYNISLPSQLHSVPFRPRFLVEGNDDIWSGYFNEIYKDDLQTVHAGVRDLAKDIAGNLASELDMIGLFEPVAISGVIDPRDNVGILEFVNGAIEASITKAMKGLRGNPGFYQGLLANLWQQEKDLMRGLMDYIELNYDTIANRAANVWFARESLASSMLGVASSDPDYHLLDDNARGQLQQLIIHTIDDEGLAQAAFERAKGNDVAKFESMYEKAISLDTPPTEGGLYQRMIEMITGTTGILTKAGDFVRIFLEGLTRNERISNDKILIPAYTQPFKFRSPGLLPDNPKAGLKEEALIVDQSPDLLTITQLTRDGSELPGNPEQGELWVDILEPVDVPLTRDSPNVHYTQVDRISDRPFQTQWTITIKGSVGMTVSTERVIYLDPRGLIPVMDELEVPLNATLIVTTFSGWPLEGVSYASSNTFGGDLWANIQSFLDEVWDAASTSLGWILDGAKSLLDQLSSLIDYVLAQAAKILEFVYDCMNKVIEMLQAALEGVIKGLLESLDYILESLPKFEFNLSGFGLKLRIVVNGDRANRLLFEATLGSFNVTARFVNLKEAGIVPRKEWVSWDVLAYVEGSIGSFSFNANIDPMMLVNDRIVRARALWGESFVMDLVVPEVEVYHSYGYSVTIPIPVPPFGEMDIELGFRVRASERLETIDVWGIISHSIQEGMEQCGGFPTTLDMLADCVERVTRHFVDDLLAAIEQRLSKIMDVTLYIKATFVFEYVLGVGASLSLTIEQEGLLELFTFIADNIRGFLDCIFDDVCMIHMENAPRRIGEHIFVTLGIFTSVIAPTFLPFTFPPSESAEVAVNFAIGANLALLGRIVGLDLGDWEIDFGMVIENLPAWIAPGIFGDGAEWGDLWIFKGTVTAQ